MNANYTARILECESRIDISFGRLTMYPFCSFNRDFYKLYFLHTEMHVIFIIVIYSLRLRDVSVSKIFRGFNVSY